MKQFSFEVLLESPDCENASQRETVPSSMTGYSKRTTTEAEKGVRNNAVAVLSRT